MFQFRKEKIGPEYQKTEARKPEAICQRSEVSNLKNKKPQRHKGHKGGPTHRGRNQEGKKVRGLVNGNGLPVIKDPEPQRRKAR
jgi:hypothetical protein